MALARTSLGSRGRSNWIPWWDDLDALERRCQHLREEPTAKPAARTWCLENEAT